MWRRFLRWLGLGPSEAELAAYDAARAQWQADRRDFLAGRPPRPGSPFARAADSDDNGPS
jgi:hypothetical protein